MAETMNSNSDNQTMRHEQAKASVSGQGQSEQGGMSQDREKSAISGGRNDSERSQSGEHSQTGEPGRARSELDQGQNMSRSEPAGQR